MPPKGRRGTSSRALTSKRAKKTKAPPPPPPPMPWPFANAEQASRFKVLATRTIIPSKFFDAFTIHNLGLRREVTTFVNNIGWTQFASIQSLTYTQITWEVLSTLKSSYNPYDTSDFPCISFRCMGENRTLTMNEFNAIFGFPSEGVSWNILAFAPDHAWCELTGQALYNPSQSKSTFIRNHALRYIHQIMSMSIFGRGESTGVVNKVELLFLWAMSHNVQVNTGAWFLKHLLHISESPTGKICVGGLLTVVAEAYDFVPDADLHHVVEGSHIVNIDTLVHMRICRHIGGGQFRLLDDIGHVLQPDEEELEDAPEEEEQAEPEVDLSGFPEAFPDHQLGSSTSHEFNMSFIMDKFDQLETWMTHSEDMQQQMLQLLQQNAEATNRIEDKLSRFR